MAAQDIGDAVQGAVKGVQRQVSDVANTPGRLKRDAEEKVAETIDGFSRDDGRILDESSPAGAVGALAVGSAVLPYVPLSLYSSYLVVTTGQGVEPGPNGIYGIAEGLGTLTILLVVLWSLTSFITRARGLPEGPFGILGATQGLSWFAAAVFGASQVLAGGGTTNAPKFNVPDFGNLVKNIKMPPVDLKMPSTDFEVPSANFNLPSANFEMPDLSGISKDLSAKLEDAKKQAGNAVSEVSSKASRITPSVQDVAKDGAKAQEGAKDPKEVAKTPGMAKDAKELLPAQPPKKEKEAGGPKSFDELVG